MVARPNGWDVHLLCRIDDTDRADLTDLGRAVAKELEFTDA
jgi:hypothetical protein